MEKVAYFSQLILAGMAGALVRSLVVHKGSIILWRMWEKDGVKGFDLGILGSLLIGAAVGMIVDQNPMNAFYWSITGSYLVEELAKVSGGANPLKKVLGECEPPPGEDESDN